MNGFFPVSVTLLTFAAGCWMERLAAATTPGAEAGFALLTALTLLALLEHWFMVLPLPDQKLWRWMIDPPAPKTPGPARCGTEGDDQWTLTRSSPTSSTALKAEGNYRIYANLQRQCGTQTRAVNHRGTPREVTVWCSNDYLGMAPSPHRGDRDGRRRAGLRHRRGRHAQHLGQRRPPPARWRRNWPTCTARNRRCSSPRAMCRTGPPCRPSARASRTR